uniref:Uncharacterized protein n=1 Tax=Sphenodon punctatus TaxID=8508 RepID=A0A8D0GIS6_SPHPU
MIHLLAGLEDDGYQIIGHRSLSQHYSPGSGRNPPNSDDEENEPQIEKEEMELSLIMSQRWDSDIEEDTTKRRFHPRLEELWTQKETQASFQSPVFLPLQNVNLRNRKREKTGNTFSNYLKSLNHA